MIKSGVYCIRHRSSGKCYVGSSARAKNRISQHKSCLRRSNHPNPKLQSAWNKYGIEAFEFTILEWVEDQNDLHERESFYISLLKSITHGYNIRLETKTNLGIKHSLEAKQNMRDGNMAALMAGKAMSAEGRARVSTAMKARRAREKVEGKPGPNLGRKFSDKVRQAMSIAHKGKGHPHTDESRAKISAAHKGVPWTADEREIHTESRRNRTYKATPEHRARLSAAAKQDWEKRRGG